MTIELVFEKTTEGSRRPKWKRILEQEGTREKLKKRNGRKRKKQKYMRRCSRCGKIYRTKSKYSMVCDDCKLPQGKGVILKNEIK